MTDHGGAASPRTATQALIDENRRLIEERDRLRAVQEAPAPEGLLAELEAIENAVALAIRRTRDRLAATPPTPAEPPQDDDHHPACCGACDTCLQVCWGDHDRSEARPPEGLDAAWAAAEAALPEGWRFGSLIAPAPPMFEGIWPREWEAHALDFNGATVRGRGPTPAAALRTLAARLSAEGATKPEAADR